MRITAWCAAAEARSKPAPNSIQQLIKDRHGTHAVLKGIGDAGGLEINHK